jgi:hypothetical protein
MSIEQILDFYRAKPFRPFIMHLANGKKIPVHRPEYFSRSPGGRTVVVFELDDTTHFIEVSQVTNLEIADSHI